ncbi:hypothetical protein LOK49_LG06G02873 [Camellia lanceoleosa]|uniref:Uncharacterized protein n=1 Tax=Camellia lanceoleosa TaxID=1840588 RepID=A0ACC0HFP8_9ERIC|nr:hypothetical protein LOK49_LG06G02873 [Camellia lanceoleosa]
MLIDIDFRSEFEIARSTGSYKAILQSLPHIFVGRAGRLHQIVSILSEAARQSLKKKGMHIPPWRKAEYMRAKWLSPHTRTTTAPPPVAAVEETHSPPPFQSDCGEFELIFGDKTASEEETESPQPPPEKNSGEGEKLPVVASTWQPPAIKPKSCERGVKVVTGLASLLREIS